MWADKAQTEIGTQSSRLRSSTSSFATNRFQQHYAALTYRPESSEEKYSAPRQCLRWTIRPSDRVDKTPHDEKWAWHRQKRHDTQLYIACSVDDAASALSTLCMSRLASLHSWFSHNGPALNPRKLKAIISGSRQRLNSFPRPSVIHILSSSVPISDYITTLGITLDSNLTVNKHVSSVCKSAYYSIKALRHIRPVLTCDMARAVVASLTQYSSELPVAISINCNASRVVLQIQLPPFYYSSTDFQSLSELISKLLRCYITYVI